MFCASLADVFDNQVPEQWRDDLWHLIQKTPHLDWLLLTKRPQNIRKMLPGALHEQPMSDEFLPTVWPQWPWPNVWLGTTAEDEKHFLMRWPFLSKVAAAKRFVSYEPALGPFAKLDGLPWPLPDWIIAGGESGGNARAPNPQWFRDVRDECAQLGIAYLFKQWGEWAPAEAVDRATVLKSSGTHTYVGDNYMMRVGKKLAGRLLDGTEHNATP